MNPILGVLFHWLGGLASGSFYVPYRRVRNWSWETYWLAGGFFSWIIAPWLLAFFMTNDLLGVLRSQSSSTLAWTYFFGVLWGVGGLTFGLALRYLGMSLGMGAALGYCAAFGTLMPPIAKSFIPTLPINDPPIGVIAATLPGKITLVGVAVCLVGIAIAALAGLTKEREMTEEEKRDAIKEFNFSKGILVASFAGIMSACFAFALTAAAPIAEASKAAGTSELWTGLPKLVVLLLGGFTTNFIWCLLLNLKNGSTYEYVTNARLAATHGRHDQTIVETAIEAPSEEMSELASIPASGDLRIPLANNYFFSAVAGTTWYMQFFFYTMGETQMGRFGFASWTLHMASIIIFSTMWGVIFHEWRGASRRAHALITAGIGTLILSTVIIGYGAWLKANAAGETENPAQQEETVTQTAPAAFGCLSFV